MRKVLTAIVCLAALCGIFVFAVARHRASLLNSGHAVEYAPRQMRAYLTGGACEPNQLTLTRIVVVHLLPANADGRHGIRFNADDIPQSEIQQRLDDIFKTRIIRTVYAVNDFGKNSREWNELLRKVKTARFVDKVCLIDPQHPPKWYPPDVIPLDGAS